MSVRKLVMWAESITIHPFHVARQLSSCRRIFRPAHDLFLVSVRCAVPGPWLFQALGRRLALGSQFGKGLLYVNVAGRVFELRTFFVSLKIFLPRSHPATKPAP